MDLTFTGRGVPVTDEIRALAEHKLGPIERLEPRTIAIDLELINENHPKPDGLKRVEAAVRMPRKTFRAEAEAADVSTAMDRVKEKLERQIRDYHGKKRVPKKHPGVESAQVAPTEEQG